MARVVVAIALAAKIMTKANWCSTCLPSQVRDVAKVMVADAERCLTQGVKGTSVVEMKELMKTAKEMKQQ